MMDSILRILGWVFVMGLCALLFWWTGTLFIVASQKRKLRESQSEAPDPEPDIPARLRELRDDITISHAADDKKVRLLGLIADRLELLTVALTQKPVPAEGMVSIGDCLDHFGKSLSKQHTMTMAALDALIEGQEKSAKSHRELMRTFFGNGTGPGYSEIDDDAGALRERAEKLQKRYGISWADAMTQAKAASVYDPQDGAMRERV